jgi:hypothetical protein
VLFLRHGQPSATAERTAAEFTELMMVERPDYEWVGAEDFVAAGASVLSLLIMLPTGTGTDRLLAVQQWLQGAGLLRFSDAGGRKSNGEGEGVVCKHVHVPGLGPEIDVSPAGVNKGSAIMKLMADTVMHLGVAVAVGRKAMSLQTALLYTDHP